MYEAEQDKSDNIFCSDSGCILIFELSVKAGENEVTLNKVDSDSKLIKNEKAFDLNFSGKKFKL